MIFTIMEEEEEVVEEELEEEKVEADMVPPIVESSTQEVAPIKTVLEV